MSVSDIIASQIIAKLEDHIIPWKPTWKLKVPMNYVSKRPYSGINMMLLSTEDYPYPYYLTFKQIQDYDAKIKKGEEGHIVTWLFNPKSKEEENQDEDNSKYKKKSFLKYYYVWNISQTTLEIDTEALDKEMGNTLPCEQIIKHYPNPPAILHEQNNPCYNRSKDIVMIPEITDFEHPEAYYATLFHELVHSTGHQSRLKRKSLLDSQHFGSEEYSLEELVAEIGAYLLCAKSGIQNITQNNSLAYIKGWLDVLKNNTRMIFTAAHLAQEAESYINTGEAV